MSTRGNRSPWVTMIPGVGEPERFLHRTGQNLSNNRQTGRAETEAQKQAPLTTGGESEREASFRLVADEMVSEKQLANVKTTPVAPLTSEQLLVRDAVAAFPEHIERMVGSLVLGKLTENHLGVNNHLPVASETIVVRTLH